MQLFFAGAESLSHLNMLKSFGVQRVAVNVNNLARHTKDYRNWVTQDRLGSLDWIVYADTPTCPPEPVLELLAGAQVACEAVAGPVTWAEDTWLKDSDTFFLPIWDGLSAQVLRTLVEDYEGVVLTDSVVDNAVAVRTAKAALPPLGTLCALTGRTKGIERFDTLVSSAWWAVQKHGETQIWTGNRMVRLNSEDKHLKRQRYAEAIDALGCNVGAVLADDPTETTRCAVLSWLALEKHVNTLGKQLAVASPVPTGRSTSVTAPSGVASAPPQTRHQLPPAAQSAPAALVNLPTMGLDTVVTTYDDAEGNPVSETTSTIEVTGSSARQCSTCQLSAACPAFSPGSVCHYHIPVVIRTTDQRRAVVRALLEIQTQRILMGSFSEQVLGTPDVQVGKEMDRLMAIMEKAKSLDEAPTSKLRISVDTNDPAAGAGVISRLFGETAGYNARQLERPMMVDEIIEEAEMVDDTT